MADIPLPSTNQPSSASSSPRPTPPVSPTPAPRPPAAQPSQPTPQPPPAQPQQSAPSPVSPTSTPGLPAAQPSQPTPSPPSQQPSPAPSGTPSPAPPPSPPQSRTRQLFLGLLAGGGVALVSGGCVLVLSTMFFFAFWNDGSNDMTFVTLWGLSSVFGGGLAAAATGLILGGLVGWYVYQRF